jgi:glycosyltransferase involved in cell wall biosynthesis
LSSRPPQPLLVDLVVVARNCAGSLGPVLASVPSRELRSVVVVDNGSADTTPLVARDAGAVLLHETSDGHGAACRRALSHLESLPQPPDVVVFMSGDGGDDPRDIPALLEPVRSASAELVVGTRAAGPGTVADRALIGLIGLIYRHRFTDLGRFRAIRFPALVALGLTDRGSGWDVEMQVKALRFGLRIVEVPVSSSAGAVEPVSRATEIGRAVSVTGRRLFQILRHSTAR